MSETVKLIIEITKEHYESTKKLDKKYPYMLAGGETAIAHGIPLDTVKARIEKQIERDFAFAKTETLKVPCHYGIANGLQNALLILESIGEGESDAKLYCLFKG